MKAICISICCAGGLAFSSITIASPILINDFHLSAMLWDSEVHDSTLPSSGSETITNSVGASSNASSVHHLATATSEKLTFNMTHSLTPTHSNDHIYTQGVFRFTALEDSTYSMKGFYSMIASTQT